MIKSLILSIHIYKLIVLHVRKQRWYQLLDRSVITVSLILFGFHKIEHFCSTGFQKKMSKEIQGFHDNMPIYFLPASGWKFICGKCKLCGLCGRLPGTYIAHCLCVVLYELNTQVSSLIFRNYRSTSCYFYLQARRNIARVRWYRFFKLDFQVGLVSCFESFIYILHILFSISHTF